MLWILVAYLLIYSRLCFQDYALGVHGNDGYSKFQELYPFECEDFDDTIASGKLNFLITIC